MAHTVGERPSEQVGHTPTWRNTAGTTLTEMFVTETPNPMAAQSNRRSGYFPGKRPFHKSSEPFICLTLCTWVYGLSFFELRAILRSTALFRISHGPRVAHSS